MNKYGDKLGQLDDESAIYRADDPEQKVRWGRALPAYLLGGLIVAGVLAAGRALDLPEAAGPLALSVAAVTFLVGYVIWRRRRNKRLTGSPTTWPS